MATRHFEIQGCLGRGGFGEVYRATMTDHAGNAREVALKVLILPDDAESQPIQRLRDEAAMLQALDHPHVLTVFDLVVFDGRLGLVAEYVEGADLDALVKAKALGIRGVCQVIANVADALDYAQNTLWGDPPAKLALVHRDIKPANIRVGTGGEVKLLDFGIAKANIDHEAVTQPDSLFGSHPYMAPEQFEQFQSTPSPAVDMYGLGASLYEAATGQRLWQHSLRDALVLSMRPALHDEQLRERVKNTAIPSAIRSLLFEMLAHDPRDRPEAADLRDRLRRLALDIKGPGLVESCRTFLWPPVREMGGELVGHRFSEQRIDPKTVGKRLPPGVTILALTEKPAPPRRVPVASSMDSAPVAKPAPQGFVRRGRPPKSGPRTGPPRRVEPAAEGPIPWTRAYRSQLIGFLVFGLLALPLFAATSFGLVYLLR